MKKTIIASLVSFFIFSLMATVALAAVPTDTDWRELAATTGLSSADFKASLIKIVNVVLSLLGILAIAVILFGGFKWMVSGGAEEKVASARQMIIAGIIGLAIILASYAIVRFVVESLTA